jgi:hypothetical protein
MLRLVRDLRFPDGFAADMEDQFRMQTLDTVARELIDLGFKADAVPLLSEAVKLAEVTDPLSAPAAVLNTIQTPEQIRQHLNLAITKMNSTDLAPLAGRLITETSAGSPEKSPSRSRQANPRDQALDMVSMVYPHELDRATVRSLLAESLAGCNSEQLKALEAPLESVRKTHPDDLSVVIAIALHALSEGDTKRIEPALERLDQLVRQSPLEPLAAGTRPNSRQRTEAARQVPLWFVARACRKQTSAAVHERGERLAALALEAAGRQTDSHWILAMLREQGEVAFKHHDLARAEALWARMLSMVTTADKARVQRPPPARAAGGAGAQASPAATKASPKPARARAKAKINHEEAAPPASGASGTTRH